MNLDLSDSELDYVYRLLLTRPMGEVEPLVVKIRRQVAEGAKPTLRAVATPDPKDEPLESLP